MINNAREARELVVAPMVKDELLAILDEIQERAKNGYNCCSVPQASQPLIRKLEALGCTVREDSKLGGVIILW